MGGGTGTSSSTDYCRLVQRGGKLNLIRQGLPVRSNTDIYHRLVILPWYWLLLLGGVVLLGLNVFFAILYWLVDGVVDSNQMPIPNWWVCFFLSVHTQYTIGYGSLSPANISANIITGIQCWLCTLVYAILGGLTFAKISSPVRIQRNIVFSEHALITTKVESYRGGSLKGHGGTYREGTRCLVFQVTNLRKSAICDPHFTLLCLLHDPSSGTEQFIFQELNFEIAQQRGRVRGVRMSSLFLDLPWNIIHPIDQSSPFFKKSYDQLVGMRVEIIPIVDGIDETCSDNLQAKWSYVMQDIVWDDDFVPMLPFARKKLSHSPLQLRNDNDNVTSRSHLHQQLVVNPPNVHVQSCSEEKQPLLDPSGSSYMGIHNDNDNKNAVVVHL